MSSTKLNAAKESMMNEELANSPDSKQTSVQRELDLLKQALSDPASILEPVRTVLMSALLSQAGLASLEIPEDGIIRMSLNTHKAIAEQCLAGGYLVLNDHRKAALVALKNATIRAKRSGRGTLDWYKEELAAKSKQLELTTNEIAEMSQRLHETLALAFQMAAAAGKETEFLKRRNELLRKFKS